MNQKALFSLLPLLLLIGSLNAQYISSYSQASVNALLGAYNVSGPTISLLSPTNMSFGKANYVLLYLGASPFFLVNISSTPYSAITNSSIIFNIIKPTILSNSFTAASYPAFLSQVNSYISSSAKPLSDCLAVTGLNRGVTCTLANYCQSCQLVPSCNKVLYNTNGPSGAFGLGLINFSTTYPRLNASFTNLINTLTNINASNQASRIGNINTFFRNMSSISGTIYQNPIFPPLQNITSSQLASCSSYLGAGSTALTQNTAAPGAPWYCNALGYCASLNYNYTLLHVLQARLGVISSLPILDSQIQTIALNLSNTEISYITPAITKQKSTQLANIINTTLVTYPTLVNATTILLTHISNATLLSRLNGAKSAYNNITTNYLSVNLVTTSAQVANQISLLQTTYSKVNNTYSLLVAKAQNTSSLLLKSQLNSQSYNPQVAQSAYLQLSYFNNLNGQISNTILLSSQLNSLNTQALLLYQSSLPLFSLTELSRATDAPFVLLIAPILNLPYSSVVSLSPVLSCTFAVIVGIVVLVALYLFKHSLRHKKKLLENQRTHGAWRAVFGIAIVLILLYIIGTFFYATKASTFAPAVAFTSSMASSKSAVVAINGTATPSLLSCQNMIAQRLTALKKLPIKASFSQNSCTISNSTKSLNSCLVSYAQSGTPIILIGSAQKSAISIYSFYGTMLNVQGNDTFMASCYPALLLR